MSLAKKLLEAIEWDHKNEKTKEQLQIECNDLMFKLPDAVKTRFSLDCKEDIDRAVTTILSEYPTLQKFSDSLRDVAIAIKLDQIAVRI